MIDVTKKKVEAGKYIGQAEAFERNATGCPGVPGKQMSYSAATYFSNKALYAQGEVVISLLEEIVSQQQDAHNH